MKLGVFTPVFGGLSVQEMLAKVRALEKVQAIEIGTGGWPGSDHINLDALLDNKTRSCDYRKMLADAGLTISALSCHGNPLHPVRATAKEYDETFRKTVRLAEQMEVNVVVTFSGCPGDSDTATHPNWITQPWPPEFSEVLEWQWNEKVIPYWQDTAKFAADHGVNDALEGKRIVSALRLAGYDHVMSIEHEDALASVDEGLRAAVDMLSRVILTEPPVKAWWT